MLNFIKRIFGFDRSSGPLVRLPGSSSLGGYGYNKAKASPKIFFNKVLEKLESYDRDIVFSTPVDMLARNKFLALKSEVAIVSQLGNPIQRLELKEGEDLFTSLKYNYNISDYSVRLIFLLINDTCIGFLYEFKEVFTHQNSKLRLVFESVFENYKLSDSTTLNDFIQKSERNAVQVCDKNDNRIIILNNVLLNVFYIHDAAKLKDYFHSIQARKEESEEEIKRRRMENLNQNL